MAKVIFQLGKVGVKILGVIAVFCITFWAIETLITHAQTMQFNKQADTLEQRANTYCESKQYPEAEQVYQDIIHRYPNTDYEFRAYKGLAILYINSDNIEAAEETINTLINNFSEHPDLPETLYWIAEGCRWTFKFEKAKDVYQQVIQNHPENLWADRAKLGIARADVLSLIVSKDYELADEAIDKLIADFSEHPDLPETLYQVGERYEWLPRFKKAKDIYQEIAQNYPDSPWADRARLGISRMQVLSLIASRDYYRAEEAVDRLISDFSEHPDLPTTLYWLAERYRWACSFTEEKHIYQQIIQNHPESFWADKAKLGIARADILSLIPEENYKQSSNRIEEALDKLAADFYDHPDLPDALYCIAERYRWSGRYEKAKDIYQYIIWNYPENPNLTKAELGFERTKALSSIKSGNYYPYAQEIIYNLTTNFAGHPDLPYALYEIAQEGYVHTDDLTNARVLHEYIASHYPENEYGINSAVWIAKKDIQKLIKEKRFEEAYRHTDIFLSRFADHEAFGKEICTIAGYYATAHKPGRARQLYRKGLEFYQHLAKNKPNSEKVIWVKVGIIRTNIALGNIPDVKTVIDQLIAEFPAHPDLVKEILDIGFAYYTKASLLKIEGDIDGAKTLFKKAIQVWERVTQEFSHPEITTWAYYVSAICYAQELCEYQKSIDYFQAVVDSSPGCEYAGSAQYSVGEYYEKLLKEGSVSESKAIPQIEDAYNKVIENYPYCEWVENALLGLGELNPEITHLQTQGDCYEE